jgi:hypothetical protein
MYKLANFLVFSHFQLLFEVYIKAIRKLVSVIKFHTCFGENLTATNREVSVFEMSQVSLIYLGLDIHSTYKVDNQSLTKSTYQHFYVAGITKNVSGVFKCRNGSSLK